MTPADPDLPPDRASQHGPWQLFMLGLCLYALGALAVETVVPLEQETRSLLHYADTLICVLFFADFVVQLVRAPDRWRYFTRWGWLDLLSSIPMVDALRVGRLARVLRILRVLRGVRATRLVATFLLARRAQGTFLAAALLTLLLVVFASVAVLQFEHVEGANIRSASDAAWWAVTTVTTVGYGDRFPVTDEGRLVAAMLMVMGVGLFGTFSGFVASWFLQPGDQGRSDDIRALREEVAALRRLLEERADVAAGTAAGD